MNYVILFVVTFLIVYLLYLLTVILNKKKLEKFKKSNQALYFIKKYKIKVDDNNVKLLAHLVALSNAFIMSTAIVLVELVPNFILKILVAFLVIMPLILILYHMVGKIMLKRGKKHV